MYTIKNTTGGCGAKNPIPPGNSGDILYLVSSGVAGAASNVFYTGDGNLYAANSVTTTNVYLSSGVTNSTTGQIVKGAVEFNGTSNVFYGTSSTVRGLIPVQYFYQMQSDTAFGTTTSGTVVSAFPGFTTGIQLQNGKYYMKMVYIVSITTSGTAGNTSSNIAMGGGSSTSSLSGCGILSTNSTSTTALGSTFSATPTTIYITGTNSERISAITTATSTATFYYTTLEGTFSITAPGGWYPTASITSPGTFTATPGVRRGSFIYLQKIGDNGANVNIGEWT